MNHKIAALTVALCASVAAVTIPKEWVHITTWSTEDMQYAQGDIDIHNPQPWASEGSPFFIAYGGHPPLPDQWPHPNRISDPPEWEHDWNERQEWLTVETEWMDWTQEWASPFVFNIAHIRVIADREIDPSSLWIINVDLVGHSANLLKADTHTMIDHSTIRWGKGNQSFEWSFPHAPVGMLSVFAGNPVHIGFNFEDESVMEELQ